MHHVKVKEMFDIYAKTFMTATRMDAHDPKLTRVRDVPKWDAPRWWRSSGQRKSTRYIDLENL